MEKNCWYLIKPKASINNIHKSYYYGNRSAYIKKISESEYYFTASTPMSQKIFGKEILEHVDFNKNLKQELIKIDPYYEEGYDIAFNDFLERDKQRIIAKQKSKERQEYLSALSNEELDQELKRTKIQAVLNNQLKAATKITKFWYLLLKWNCKTIDDIQKYCPSDKSYIKDFLENPSKYKDSKRNIHPSLLQEED